MNTISYMIFADSNSHQYAIQSNDCVTFATDPGEKEYQAHPVDSKGGVVKQETVSVFKANLTQAGCIVTQPAT